MEGTYSRLFRGAYSRDVTLLNFWLTISFCCTMARGRFGNDPERIHCSCSERALLNYFLARLKVIDPDVLVGHNIAAFDMSLLFHRMNANKVIEQHMLCCTWVLGDVDNLEAWGIYPGG